MVKGWQKNCIILQKSALSKAYFFSPFILYTRFSEYSGAAEPLFRKSGNRLSGIFTEFVALILISYLDHKMGEANLYKTYSMQQLLDRLDVLECFEDEGHRLRIEELTTKQADIYEALGVALPTSSC